MYPQYCKIGKVTSRASLKLRLKQLEEQYHRFMEEAYSLMYIDSGISDILFFEALRLKKRLLRFKSPV
ncbi:hypothetical protein [Aegicerativicinus sediminis]|uniref:hypothetical protein n=1 Tax=Aegicerativicinus sediminis TaxID=2893202 RepID=UPI001E587F9D|nr:hypothetical protein [Aegicerativicinus sediminis]